MPVPTIIEMFTSATAHKSLCLISHVHMQVSTERRRTWDGSSIRYFLHQFNNKRCNYFLFNHSSNQASEFLNLLTWHITYTRQCYYDYTLLCSITFRFVWKQFVPMTQWRLSPRSWHGCCITLCISICVSPRENTYQQHALLEAFTLDALSVEQQITSGYMYVLYCPGNGSAPSGRECWQRQKTLLLSFFLYLILL